MPIIKFSKADILRSQLLENETWYSWIVKSITGPTHSADKQSYNYVTVLELIGHPNPDINGKEVTRTFNSKAIGMMLPFVAAVQGKEVTQAFKDEFELNTEELVGKKVDGKYKIDTFEGRLVGKVEEYLPHGLAKSQTAPF